jgi:phage terminase large subunit
VARFGDDRTALAKRQANKLLEPIRWWHSTDLMATVGRIKGEYDQTHYDTRPWAIFVDVIGLGASTRENCMRLRDELWFKGREWFQDRSCSMPQDEALIAELTTPTYTFSSTGKMVVESKADMKKRGLRSPDLADAFLLTFPGGERRKERYRKPEPRNYSAWAV